jgi:putative phosphoesterase
MPTKLAVLADVHADVEALCNALAQIDRLGCGEIVCAGDLVGYGVFPEETVALVRERKIVCVRGNHDRWAVGDGTPEDQDAGDRPHDASGWGLSGDARRFLRSLPRVWRKTFDGVGVVMVHGSVADEMDGVFPDVITGQQLRKRLDVADADVLIVGHVHEPFEFKVGRRIVLNTGALLRRTLDGPSTIKVFDTVKDDFVEVPRSPGGTFGVLELPSRKFIVRSASTGAVVKILRVATG